jgi:hypothetical protein
VDPYVVLGVESGASPDEIEAAYVRRGRLHDPTVQETDAERTAAERYHAELADAYRALLGTAPPVAPSVRAVGSDSPSVRHDPARGSTVIGPRPRGPSPGRDVLVVLGTLVAAFVVFQLPVALGFGFGGLIIGVIAAVALVGVVLAHERRRRA